MTLGTPRLHLREVDSTNVRAQRLAASGAPHGALVTAAGQTAGHGRQGRAWITPPGRALACSLLLRDPPRLLPMLAALAVADAADQLDTAGRTAAIKWPNDVLLNRRKVAGILAEGRPQEGWVVLGIGLNVAVADFPPELRTIATSLGCEPQQLEPALTLLLERLEHWLSAPPEQAMDAYRQRDALAGREISWGAPERRGTAIGIADDGRLRVKPANSSEEELLDAGEVHLGSGT